MNIVIDNFTLNHSVGIWKQTLNKNALQYMADKILMTRGKNYQLRTTLTDLKLCYITVLHDGTLATGSSDGIVRIYSTKRSLQLIHSFKADDAPIVFILLLKDKRLLTRNNVFTMRLWNEYKLVQTIAAPFLGPIKELNGILIVKYTNTRLNVYKVGRLYKELALLKSIKRSGVFCDAIQIKDRRLVTASENGEIKIFDPIQFKCVKVMKGHRSRITSMLELSDGNLLTASNELRLWDHKDKYQCIKVIKYSNEISKVTQVGDKIIVYGNQFVEVYNYKYGFELVKTCLTAELMALNRHMLYDERIIGIDNLQDLIIKDPRKNGEVTHRFTKIYEYVILKDNRIIARDGSGNLVIFS
jgi:WD40 repeat protein